MNLQAIAVPVIAAVNPPITATLMISTGYTVGPDFSQVPSWATVAGVQCQVQPLSSDDLRQLEGLNVQGTHRAVYLNGNIEGIDRQAVKGGDMLQFPSLPDFPGQTTWLVTQVLEHWGDGQGAAGWSRLAVTLQNGS